MIIEEDIINGVHITNEYEREATEEEKEEFFAKIYDFVKSVKQRKLNNE